MNEYRYTGQSLHDLPRLKELLLIPDLWHRLGLPGTPRPQVRSPFRPDRSPSFSIYDGGRRWIDHATGEGGDVIDFLAQACQVDVAEATRRFLTMVGQPVGCLPAPNHKRAHEPKATSGGLTLPALHAGSQAELEAVARSRQLDVQAISLAQSLRTLAFAQVCGHASWLLMDEASHIAEARRMDGRPYPAQGSLGERKAHSLRGSSKSWPCGVAVLRRLPQIRTVLLVEGGPDYLAALHLLLALEVWHALPVAMLGRSTGTRIHPQALQLLAGRHICLCPHLDADGGGKLAAQHWANQLHDHGCTCTFLDLEGLRHVGESPVTDLNEAALLPLHYLSELKQNLTNNEIKR